MIGAPRTVLVVITRQIGDVLLTTPLLREARRLWPQARIDILGFPGTLAVLEGNADVDGLVAMPQGSGWRALRSLAPRLWRRYDLALVAEISDRAHLAGWIAARCRVGLLPALEDGPHRLKRALLAHAVRSAGDRGDVHVVQEKLQLLAPWRREEDRGGQPVVVAPAAAPLPPELAARLHAGKYVVVHAPSMWEYKQWPVASFSRLIELLCGAGHQVVLSGGPGEADRSMVRRLRDAHAARDVVDAGVLTFNQLSGLLQSARLYIGPDTSISHLAAATGTPVVAIFGPTNPQRWAPWPSGSQGTVRWERSRPVQQLGNVSLLQSGLACVPCGRAGCEDHRASRSLCLHRITPEAVMAEAAARLAIPRA